MARDISRGINGSVGQIRAFEVLLIAYPAIITLALLLSAVVLYMVRKDARGVLDGEDVATQYMVDNTGKVFKEGEEIEVGLIVHLFFDTLD